MTEPVAPAAALDLEFYCRDLRGHVTVRQYMQQLLVRLFREGESFSGKRPFGNSGWEYDLAVPLVAAGAVRGQLDVYGAAGREVYNPEDSEQDVSAELENEEEYWAYVARVVEAL